MDTDDFIEFLITSIVILFFFGPLIAIFAIICWPAALLYVIGVTLTIIFGDNS